MVEGGGDRGGYVRRVRGSEGEGEEKVKGVREEKEGERR